MTFDVTSSHSKYHSKYHSNFPSPTIAIIGAGAVGSTTAYAATMRQLCGTILLIDSNEEKEKGEVMDIGDTLCFVETGAIRGANLRDAREADIIIITAGKPQDQNRPTSRLSLLEENKKIMRSIFKQIGMIQSHAIVIVVSNPVDVLTSLAQKLCHLPPCQVFGTGTTLDTARLRTNLARRLHVHAAEVRGYVLGEHGDSSFVAWSSVSVAGVPINKLKDFSTSKMNKVEEEVRQEVYDIIRRKGATYYGIGLTVVNILAAILHDQKAVLPVSSLLTRWHGISGVCLGVPAVIGKSGVERLWPLALSAKEKRSLKKSAQLIASYI